jgi:hypothetical protein
MNTPFHLERSADGRLACTLADGTRHEGVVPARAFPLSAPDEGLSLSDPQGHEVLWIDRLPDVPASERSLIEQELASREFAPVVERLVSVSTFSTPSTWTVHTDRGETRFVLKGEEDIRRLEGHALLITDANGANYRVRDRLALDRHSRRLLERFL